MLVKIQYCAVNRSDAFCLGILTIIIITIYDMKYTHPLRGVRIIYINDDSAVDSDRVVNIV